LFKRQTGKPKKHLKEEVKKEKKAKKERQKVKLKSLQLKKGKARKKVNWK